MKVSERIEQLRLIKEIRDRGDLLCIPYYKSFPKLSKFVPGIIKGVMYKVTAGSGVGKTQLTKALFVIAPLNYLKENPDSKLKIKIFYFALEESEEEFIDTLICNQLAYKYDKRVDVMTLKGYREDYPDDDLMAMIEDVEEDVEFFMKHIEVVDSVSNPTGMYKYCRHYSEQVGDHIWEKKQFQKTDANGVKSITEEDVYVEYKPHDPNLHVICITDHFSLITPERQDGVVLSQHQSMAKWSTKYCRGQMTKHWGWTCVGVQQQEQGSEKQQFTMKGESIVEKTEPNLSALANNKEIQRDDYIIISLYSPDRFGFNDYNGYNIKRMRDTFRVIKILKNRLGIPNKYVPLLFDGSCNRFAEIPLPDQEEIKYVYEASDKLLGRA